MRAGWRGLFAIEKDPLAFQTLRRNLIRPRRGTEGLYYDWPIWLPRQPTTIGLFIDKYREQIRGLAGTVDLIAGGPPCQGFSFAGRRDRNDRRNLLTERYYIEMVRLVRPAFVLLENVKGMAIEFRKKERLRLCSRGGRPPKSFSQRVQDDLEAAGYVVHVGTARAVDFGVAQFRPRHIMVAIRRDRLRNVELPSPFKVLRKARLDFLSAKRLRTDRPITARQAISDLETSGKSLVACVDSPGAKQIVYERPMTPYQRLLHSPLNGKAPNSLRLAMHTRRISARFSKMLRDCRKGVKLSPGEKKKLRVSKHQVAILSGNTPSHTLTTLPDDLLHYSEPRILTVRECARLQSFPDWYEFKGKYCTGGPERKNQTPRYTQVANAVPPFLAEVLGKTLGRLKRRIPQHPSKAGRRRPCR
jgi:DNA (cytosine-5)-methyltransferase 1